MLTLFEPLVVGTGGALKVVTVPGDISSGDVVAVISWVDAVFPGSVFVLCCTQHDARTRETSRNNSILALWFFMVITM